MIHQYPDYSWLRGFNVIFSWGATIQEAWLRYSPSAFRREIEPLPALHANCVRLWMDPSAWFPDPEGTAASFRDAVSAIDEAGMRVMPVLSNRWHDRRYDYGGVYEETLGDLTVPPFGMYRDYLESIVRPLVSDERILMWDLCNEPQSEDSRAPVPELVFLGRFADELRRMGVQQPITVGTSFNGQSMNLYAHLCDVLCCHPYAWTMEALEEQLKYAKSLSDGWRKPIVCNECIPGASDDRVRAEYLKRAIPLFEKYGCGWMGWGFRYGKAVAARRDRVDGNGLDNCGFHAWTKPDGSLRDGLEFLKETPNILPPWQK